ncbi:MAG: cbb3-type cytochrome c oxidase subunit II [Leptospiraceae bacterium]|nr:cbb3-type cytochrome c oxidase subunit II [Leptospiraceae bacterium]
MSGNYADKHTELESRGILFPILVTLAILVGGIVEVIPPFFMTSTVEPIAEVKPYSALELAGRDIYIREGCINCHSQMIRPFKWETARFDPAGVYGDEPYSKAGEYVYDRPFLWGSKRTGPDLWHESQMGKDRQWHYDHFRDQRMGGNQAGSVMPAYPWLFENKVDGETVKASMQALQALGTPYSDAEINNAPSAVEGKTEADALVEYMMKLGRDAADAAASTQNDSVEQDTVSSNLE